jgi:hypothetical protein
MRGVAWIALVSSLGGLMVGLLLGTGVSCREPERAPPEPVGVIPGAGVIVIRVEPLLEPPAEYRVSMPDEQTYRYDFTFRDRSAATRAGDAARKSLQAEFQRAMRGE